MHFAIDGTLWENPAADGYDRMVLSVLEGLRGLGHTYTILGKKNATPATASHWAETAPNWREQFIPGGWLKKTVPRVMRERGLDRWVSWTGQAVPEEVPQTLLRVEPLKGVRLTTADGKAGVILPPYYPPAGPFAWEEREAIRATYSDRREYFLWLGVIDRQERWKEVMKAFSQFKIRQRSQMRLLIAPWRVEDPTFQESLDTYKYRADVRVMEQWAPAAPGAYAWLYTAETDNLGWVAAAALTMGVPLISTAESAARGWAENAVEWVDPDAFPAIVEAMLRLYKDEAYRKRLMDNGRVPDGAAVLRQYEQVLTG
jgi:glycosyltransferase involved in cell wall biosynthesis